jgi:S-adenosylmethionine:tRNA ribosyltransferase-isomerase
MEMVAASILGAAAPLALSEFEFPLPPELIAQVPAERRDAARLLGLDRRSGELAHTQVSALPELLRPGDLLVVNDTRVIPARIFGRGASGGAIELLLIRPTADATVPLLAKGGSINGVGPAVPAEATLSRRLHMADAAGTAGPTCAGIDSGESNGGEDRHSPEEGGETWLCLGKPAKRLRVGTTLTLAGGVRATVAAAHDAGRYSVRFENAAAVRALLEHHGEIPLPPYIRRPDGPLPLDRDRYQTIFAAAPGAVAAPTAGLHFTDALVQALEVRGIRMARLTLHVGPGTFLPVRVRDIRAHVMDPEWCEIPPSTAAAIHDAKAAGRRVVAVGTTTTRALESAATAGGVAAGARWADCFIVPGHRFRVVDALFTNFHLPGSTLLLLVSAFAGHERIADAYAEAIRRRYRFYSYGDAMLIQ